MEAPRLGMGEAETGAARAGARDLVLLARATRTKLGGEDAPAMAKAFVAEGWRADAAALDALAVFANAAAVAAVKVAIRAVYTPWLEAGAERFQDLVREKPGDIQGPPPRELATIEPGTCIVFADGLRLDLGKRLRADLESAGFLVEESWRWVPLPPVTPTAKPAASPVADLVAGEGSDGEAFRPWVRDRPAAHHRTIPQAPGRSRISGPPRQRHWRPCRPGLVEPGEMDRRGHNEGSKLGDDTEVIAGCRDRSLLEAGWREILVVTDHGGCWSGGLPR